MWMLSMNKSYSISNLDSDSFHGRELEDPIDFGSSVPFQVCCEWIDHMPGLRLYFIRVLWPRSIKMWWSEKAPLCRNSQLEWSIHFYTNCNVGIESPWNSWNFKTCKEDRHLHIHRITRYHPMAQGWQTNYRGISKNRKHSANLEKESQRWEHR